MLDNESLYKILSKDKIVASADLELAKKDAESKKLPLLTTLLEKGLTTEDKVSMAIANSLKLPYVKLSQMQIDEKILKSVPEVVARKQQIIAFEKGKGGLKVATCNPENLEIIKNLEKKLGLKIEMSYASEKEIRDALTLYKGKISETFHDLIPIISEAKGKALGEAPISKIVQKLFEYALDNRASDIHIEPLRKETIVRFRIDGVLHDIVKLPKNLHEEIVSRIKVLSHLRTDEHQAAQDGKLQVIYGGETTEIKESGAIHLSEKVENREKGVDVRVSITPVTNGENIVMRLLSERGRQFNLTNLGLSDNDLKKIKKEIAKSWGTIIAVGPTGCGKTTTLYAILKVLNRREINITTIEDPVEYDMEGVSQIQVNTKTNLTFANGLRSIVRQDPDVIMVGEIRDKETAGIAINAAMTGHLVLSTMHANDSATTLPRLNQMEIEPYLIASTVNLIVAQRIVRRVCSKCAEKYGEPFLTFEKNLPAAVLGKIFPKKPTSVNLTRGKGCEFCHQSGYVDRIGIFETMTMSPEIEKLVMAQANASQITEQAVKEGMTTMLEDGMKKVIDGITTLDEILRVTRE